MTSSGSEQREFDKIDEILPVLWKEDLLTDLECRIIATCNTLGEKKTSVYTIIMSKTKEKAAILMEMFRTITVAMNPFLNVMIIKHLFGFLPLEDIKRFRLVNREWNSAAEICLRKRSAIQFRPNALLPNTFMEIYKYKRPDLPFASFAFSSDDENSTWNVTDIENFFEKWEKDLKEVTLRSIKLTRQCNLTGTVVPILNYDSTPLFISPSNITSLKINYPMIHVPETNMKITLERFVSLKTLFLSNCTIIVSVENQSPPLAPLGIALQNISFIRNEEVIKQFCYNDLIDFSQALNIHLEQDLKCNIMDRILDMGKNVFNINLLKLSNVSLENWAQAKGDVKILRLVDTNFVEKNQLEIKELSTAFSKIDMSALPKTLEFFEWENSEVDCSEQLALPNLKKLSMDIEDCENFFYLNSANVVELVLRKNGEFAVTCIPESVKRMTIELSQIRFTDDLVYELDSLILYGRNSHINIRDCTDITNHIRAKLLVLVCGAQMDVNTFDLVKFVWANSQAHEILIGSRFDLHKRTPFKGSRLSECVDKKSNYYKFENRVGKGKSITQAEFEILYDVVAQGKDNRN